jgi:hypothetical protein
MMKTDPEIKAIVAFTGTPWQAGMVKSLLENEGIEAFLNDMNRANHNPGWNLPGEGGSVRVVISNLDYEKAKKVVDAYVNNQKSI